MGRASIAWQSSVDCREAQLAGAMACEAALRRVQGKMVGFRRIGDSPYRMEPFLVDIDEVMMYERKMPDHLSMKPEMG